MSLGSQKRIASEEEKLPTNPKRVKAFARFFKNYMSVSSLVVASLPIPVTSMHLIPTYKAQTSILSVYAPLFCFLTLGFIFFVRHSLARAMFSYHWIVDVPPNEPFERPEDVPRDEPRRKWVERDWKTFRQAAERYRYRLLNRRISSLVINVLPIVCILGAFFAVYEYHTELITSVASTKHFLRWDVGETPKTFGVVLQDAELDSIHRSTILMSWYIAIFVLAEASFILMAIKEYLQDLLGYEEKELIAGVGAEKSESVTTIETEPLLHRSKAVSQAEENLDN